MGRLMMLTGNGPAPSIGGEDGDHNAPLGGLLGDETRTIKRLLGDGKGKWRLFIEADQDIQAMSLLESPTGHVTNLSAGAALQ